MYLLLHSPDNGSTATVIKDGPLGLLYIQALDAYGFQRELSVTLNQDDQAAGSHVLKVYQHPGRRSSLYLTAKQAETFIERIAYFCQHGNLCSLLFNVPEAKGGRARCNGFVHLCEAIHAGRSFRDIARDNL